MPDVPHIAFVQGHSGLSQRLFSGHATLSGHGRDLRLVVDGQAQRLAYKDVHEDDSGVFEAVAENDDVHIETRLVPGPGHIEVVSRLTALRPLTLACFEHAYAVHDLRRWEQLDDLWLPVLKRNARHAIGAPALRTPCIAAQIKGRTAALIADLGALERVQPLPYVLDFERPGTIKAALAAGRPVAGGLLQRQPKSGVLLPDHDVVTLSFVIQLADGVSPHAGLGQALRLIWERFAGERLDRLSPQTLPFDDYARYACDAAFDRYALWRDVFVEEGPAGGIAFRARHPEDPAGSDKSQRRLDRRLKLHAFLSGALPWRRRRSLLKRGAVFGGNYVFFTARANQLRSAYGMAHFARRWGDEKLLGSVREIIRLAIAAPAERGLFPSVYAGTPDRPAWVRGTKGDFLDDRYSLADLSESAMWMLWLAADHGLDEGMRNRALSLGETLLGLQAENGALPARIAISPLGRIHASGIVRPEGPTAVAGALFAHLRTVTQEARFLAGARNAAMFIIDHVWPAHAWRDLETFFSNGGRRSARDGGQPGPGPQSVMSMAWAVDLLLTLHETEEAGWLDPALAILDELLFYQQIWSPDLLNFDARGGFGPMNTNARWSDARQALFAPLLLRACEATGKREYGVRAAAALRAGFTLMRVPENEKVAPGATTGIDEAAYGLTPKGYEWEGERIRAAADLSFDWGSGSACAAAAWVQRHYGDLFVDFAARNAVGLNGCRVTEARISEKAVTLHLERLGEAQPLHRNPIARKQAGTILLRARGPSLSKVRLRIDGRDVGAVARRTLLKGFPIPPPRT